MIRFRKRRLENLGEEDRFYIKDHHEPIISAETFARAQEIRERRNGGRKSVTPGKREKYSDNMHLAVCWNVGFVEQIYQGEDGIAVLNIKRRFGNALNLQRTEKDSVRIAREYRNK